MSAAEPGAEYQMLIEEIDNVIQEIQQCEALLENNERKINDCHPVEKALIDNNSFAVILQDKKLTGCSVTRPNPVQSLQNDLEKELEFICNDTAKLVKKISEETDLNARLEKNCQNLKMMLEAGSNLQTSSKNIDLIEKNIKLRFVKEKKELKTIITTLFPDNLEVQDLIAQITEYYFTEGADKYMQIENSDNVPELIEILLRTELFEINPHNPTQIRLVELL